VSGSDLIGSITAIQQDPAQYPGISTAKAAGVAWIDCVSSQEHPEVVWCSWSFLVELDAHLDEHSSMKKTLESHFAQTTFSWYVF